MKQSNSLIIAAGLFLIGFLIVSAIPNTADAKRVGGGSSMGSRGSKTTMAPKQAAPRNTMDQTSAPGSFQRSASPMAPAGASGGMFKGMGSGFLGGLGGFMLGGMLGSMLFGHGGAGVGGGGGGGIGLLEILLIGGAIWFGWRWFKRQQAQQSQMASGYSFPTPIPSQTGYSAPQQHNDQLGHQREGMPQGGLPQSFSLGGTPEHQAVVDEVSQGLGHISAMDPQFNEAQFLNGAKLAFQQLQKSWCEGNVQYLAPLLTPAMLQKIQGDLQARQSSGHKDCIENIQFQKAEISEAWQESGDDWITVCFQASMLEYTTDQQGTVIEGDTRVPVTVEEYWTFTRKVGTRDPNWLLSAIQQPDQALVA
ncbi:MAG: Tim44 domain-containing protein [Magnetococcales bacterium]|nr:Tim44 domain-containing protein [Magnetococcales bacterium]